MYVFTISGKHARIFGFILNSPGFSFFPSNFSLLYFLIFLSIIISSLARTPTAARFLRYLTRGLSASAFPEIPASFSVANVDDDESVSVGVGWGEAVEVDFRRHGSASLCAGLDEASQKLPIHVRLAGQTSGAGLVFSTGAVRFFFWVFYCSIIYFYTHTPLEYICLGVGVSFPLYSDVVHFLHLDFDASTHSKASDPSLLRARAAEDVMKFMGVPTPRTAFVRGTITMLTHFGFS